MTDDLPLFAVTHSRLHGEPTSLEAARDIAHHADVQREEILYHLREYGPATADGLDGALDWRPTTAGRRLPDLVREGLVEWTGETRPTRSGRKANVYRVKVNKQGEAA